MNFNKYKNLSSILLLNIVQEKIKAWKNIYYNITNILITFFKTDHALKFILLLNNENNVKVNIIVLLITIIFNLKKPVKKLNRKNILNIKNIKKSL